MSTTPWQISDVPGPRQATVVTVDLAARLIKRAKRPLIVLGGSLTRRDESLERVLKIAEALKAHLAVSPGLYRFLQNQDGVQVTCIGIEDLVNRLKDESWKGLDGSGGYDLVIFLGGKYYFQSLMLSTTKNFAAHLKTMSLDRFFHPNADFSFENMGEDKWLRILDELLERLR